MLQIDHRESHDVDIFLTDPQQLPFLNPQNHDFKFQIQPSDYKGDGTRFLKLAFEGVGEIDFIVGAGLTSVPSKEAEVEGETIHLETVPEIVTKKIYHRGSSITPRDIFDIAAGGEKDADSIIKELKPYKEEVAGTLATMNKLNPDFVRGAISELKIMPQYSTIAKSAMERAQEVLHAV